MNKRIAGILLCMCMTTMILTGCGEKAEQTVSDHAVTENAGNTEDENLAADLEKVADEEIEKETSDDNENGDDEIIETAAVLLPENVTRAGNRDGDLLLENLLSKKIEAEICYADQNPQTQMEQFRDCLEAGITTFIIHPVDAYAFEEIFSSLEKDQKSSIRIISYESLLMNTEQVSYYVTFDSRLMGQKTGEKIIKDFSLDKWEAGNPAITIEFVMGSLDDQNALFYYNGILEKLQPFLESGALDCKSGQLEFQQVGILGEKTEQVKIRLESLMTETYEKTFPEILVTGFDAAACTAADVLEESGGFTESETWPYLTGYGSTVEGIRYIAEGMIKFTTYSDRNLLSEACADLLDRIFQGKDLELDTWNQYDNGVMIVGTETCEGQLIDMDNYQMLIDNGFYTEEELAISTEEKEM